MWNIKPIMQVFAREPFEGLNIRELAKKAGLAYGTTHKCVTDFLLKDKIVIQSKVGKSSLIKLNRLNQLTKNALAESEFSFFKNFSQENVKLTKPLFSLLENLNAVFQYSILTIVLFGSQAKGRAIAKSDIDLLIIKNETKGQKELLSGLVAPWEFEHNKKINPVILTPNQYIEGLREEKTLIREIIKSHVTLWGAEHYWALTLKGLLI